MIAKQKIYIISNVFQIEAFAVVDQVIDHLRNYYDDYIFNNDTIADLSDDRLRQILTQTRSVTINSPVDQSQDTTIYKTTLHH